MFTAYDFALLYTSIVSYMHEWMFYLWLTVGVSLLIIELLLPSLFLFVSLAAGCFIGAILALFSDCLTWQCGGMIAGSLVSFILINKIFVKDKKERHLSNYEALIGQEGVVTKTIAHDEPGLVKIRGELWPAVSEKGIILYKGTIVTVASIAGNKVVVS